MVINIGGLWDRPIPVADESSCLPSVYSDIVCPETLPSYNIKDYQDFEVAERTYFKSLSPETYLGSNPEYGLSGCDVIKDEEHICSKDQPKSHFVVKQNTDVSTESDGEKDHLLRAVDIQIREDKLCRHASKALRVRSSAAKDRHSKVNTAKGLRDTRVMLSFSTALQLYEVHYRLGFDRPSKTLDWLMSKSQTAIDQLPEASYISTLNCSLCNSVSKSSTSSAKDSITSTYSQAKSICLEHATDLTETNGPVDACRSGAELNVPVSRIELILPKYISALSSSTSSRMECFTHQFKKKMQP